MSPTNVMLAGRYRLDGRIAAGGVGEVWRAADIVLDRPVAVKLLRAEYAEHPETLARFRAEARHAGSLSHPGIAQVYDYGEPDPPYLVMELVDGPSLASALASGPLDPARAMDVVAQAAAGLAAAHAAGLVHRDIKPGNLLLGRSGEVKITDFGIAHAAGSAPVTRIGMVIGTPAYLAPERAAGAPATAASDLYSLGVVAYVCLAGVPPFSGDPAQVVAGHQHEPAPPLPPTVPSQVAALVAELMAKDPAARPASASEVAARAGRLRDALTGSATVQLGPGARFGPATRAHAQPATRAHAQPATRAHAQPATLPGLPTFGPPAPQRLRRARQWPRRGLLLTVAAAAVIAGLVGWMLAGVPGAAPPQRPPASRSAAPGPSTPAAGMVEVDGRALAGQPVSAVRQQLRELGLRPLVVWVRSAHEAPGTVVSVRPSGRVPVGSIVTVTAVLRTHGHGKGDGQGTNQDGADNSGG